MPTPSTEYDFLQIEARWQKIWEETGAFRADTGSPKPKYYVLDMFPYPSGAGLHIGHPEGYTATDIVARYRRARGFNVLHPMGWDAFGLPAEQYAVRTGQHPRKTTEANIANFKRQIKSIGLGYDWNREVDTTDPRYFRWTQWIFLQLFERGLAYVDEKPVWWCPELGTVLANEEVVNGRSEVGGFPVERRPLRQWVLKITAYADRLLSGLKDLDWPESTKRMQETWIGRSDGCEVDFAIAEAPGEKLRVFTTRVDTLFGATYMVVAPEHPLVDRLTVPVQRNAVDAYVRAASAKSDLERTELSKEKTGVFTGSHAVNPANGALIPIWIADYVLASYGTGSIMAVPAQDERDWDFAQAHGLPVVRTVQPPEGFTGGAYVGDGTAINSANAEVSLNGLAVSDAIETMTAWIERKGLGVRRVNFKLRDWLFSRQRYWGEPFPIVWVSEDDYRRIASAPDHVLKLPSEPVTARHGERVLFAVPLPASALPLTLPPVTNYQPSGTGESPLANCTDWLEIWYDPATGASVPASQQRPGASYVRGRRETNTMPQWAGSCWYYLRYCDPTNTAAPISREAAGYWSVPDLYVGGAEHAVLHLLYARFWHKFLHDIGVTPDPEPFRKLFHQGIILGELEYNLLLDPEGGPVSADALGDEAFEKAAKRRLAKDEVEKRGKDVYVWKQDPSIRVDARSFKMSKTRGNVVNPDDIIRDYGADTLRLYLMFLGPLEAMKPWDPQGIEGVHRFLRKAWREFLGDDGRPNPKLSATAELPPEIEKLRHETIRKVGADIESLRLNTAVSQLMILLNAIQRLPAIPLAAARDFLRLLAPFAPHIAAELWERLGGGVQMTDAGWPEVDESKLAASTVTIVFQVNGKHRGDAVLPADATESDALAAAREHPKVAAQIADKPVRRTIFVKNRLLNILV